MKNQILLLALLTSISLPSNTQVSDKLSDQTSFQFPCQNPNLLVEARANSLLSILPWKRKLN